MVKPRLIVGLGNPGIEYRDTRHNIGFMVVDELARLSGATFTEEKRWHGWIAKIPGAVLLKPTTYMNDSGRSVQAVSQFYKTTVQELLVIYDDVDLPLGRLRMRLAGSAGGHNGLKSLIRNLGSDAFPRLKLGISTPSGRPAGDRLAGHVLGKFREEERTEVAIMIKRATDAVRSACETGVEAAMNLFNRKEEQP
ncbi:peptidyl-tRNA hydrolase, PTH1 family [Prosthecobacter debontii]|uniref:Peptidyl-tRNA hydrolase n=1 Tax=Prosthecobacter debontii TaxID=48467 RepID=A0A1T4XXZ3_9BACT|nr:aminoacyl-tRNA hydrolase [Prosthecobacter debontii]SKA94442.1 peptidyl-tRNA hydrolase, PTH1 family [Prosthecobacter debontii]